MLPFMLFMFYKDIFGWKLRNFTKLIDLVQKDQGKAEIHSLVCLFLKLKTVQNINSYFFKLYVLFRLNINLLFSYFKNNVNFVS